MWELILDSGRATLTGVMSELPSVRSDKCRTPADVRHASNGCSSNWVQACHIREPNTEHQLEAGLAVPQVTADRLGDFLEPVIEG
jgi:hypothetical protein